jgi:adenosylcobinamide-phosphate synthase
MDSLHYFILPAAFALDAVAGDPRWLPHPIRWMGRAIEICEPLFRRQFNNEVWAGGLFALFLISGCYAVSALLTGFAYAVRPFLGMALEVIMIFYCLSARSLCQAAMQIYYLLQKGHIDEARSKLAMIVGRDVAAYGRDDIARAAVETVAENFVDGVLSPLFFAAIGGAPLAMAYKMVNTLDSMVGYQSARYRRFGWAAARIDDMANLIPARLSIVIITLAARFLGADSSRRALSTAFKEGSHHSSPNAGYPEAAFAGALAVKLNGPNYYGGVRVDKPYIGVAFGAAGSHHIQQACRLLMIAALVSSLLAWAVSFL